MEARVKWRRYLVQRRANSINPLQLEPRQLVFSVPIKDGLREQRFEHVSAWNPKAAAKENVLGTLGTSGSFVSSVQRLRGGCAAEIVTGLPLRS